MDTQYFQGQNEFSTFEEFFTYHEKLKDARKLANKMKVPLVIMDTPTGQKYRSIKARVNGVTYDSYSEIYRAVELLRRQELGEISELSFHDKKNNIILQKPPTITYIPDFCYVEDGYFIIEDVKGMETKDFILKKKMLFNRVLTDQLGFLTSLPIKVRFTKRRAKGCVVIEEFCKEYSTKKYR